jgi:hypothetical protein
MWKNHAFALCGTPTVRRKDNSSWVGLRTYCSGDYWYHLRSFEAHSLFGWLVANYLIFKQPSAGNDVELYHTKAALYLSPRTLEPFLQNRRLFTSNIETYWDVTGILIMIYHDISPMINRPKMFEPTKGCCYPPGFVVETSRVSQPPTLPILPMFSKHFCS